MNKILTFILMAIVSLLIILVLAELVNIVTQIFVAMTGQMPSSLFTLDWES